MKFLLDTHVFLWWVMDDLRLTAGVREILEDKAKHLFLSSVSGWEMAIKFRLGKLKLPGQPDSVSRFIIHQMESNDMEPLPILMSHALAVATLPNHHEDPFDRLLVAQSKIENIPIVTADRQLARYDIGTIWKK